MLKFCNIQDFCLHDGPGIRTTIFLAGCPLRCTWCHNPETQTTSSVLIYEKEKCIGCKLCEVCPNDAHSFEPEEHRILRDKCALCGRCVSVCPASALALSHKELSDEEFYKLVEKQKRLSGENGGITFSGGEPLMQAESILRLINNTDIHTAIETCGYVDEEMFKKVIEKVDYIMFDLKLVDDELHKKYTGVSNKLILKNLENLRASGTEYVLRTPLIPGITDTEENIKALGEIVGDDMWEKLEYNVLTPSKYSRIGRECMYEHN